VELIDLDPWIARIDNLRHSGVTDTEDEAFSKWRLDVVRESGVMVAKITLELTSSPSLFMEAWKDWDRSFRERLRKLNPDFARMENGDRFKLVLNPVPLGSLRDSQICRY